MKKKDITLENSSVERLSNKDYQKALRQARRHKRAAAKEKAKTKRESEPKIYDVLIQYDKRCYKNVVDIVNKNDIKYSMLTDTYMWIRNCEKITFDAIKEKLLNCKVEEKEKVYKVRISGTRATKILHNSTRAPRKPANNTDERKIEAKRARKAKNRSRNEGAHFLCGLRNEKKKQGLKGRGAKRTYLETAEDGTTVVMHMKPHKRGSNNTTLQKKTLMRAKKAGRYIIKQEKLKALSVAKNSKNKASSKPNAKQLEFNFKKAA